VDYIDVLKTLQDIYEDLISGQGFPNGRTWNRSPWPPPWDKYNGSIPPIPVVYILESSTEKRPLYIESTTDLGKRLNDHKRRDWDTIRFKDFSNLTFGDMPTEKMMKLLERFAITVLDPIENVD
jgi:hypothetical protein